MLSFFKSGSASPLKYADPREAEAEYRNTQRKLLLTLIVGYSFFYTTRLSLSAAKKPLVDQNLLTVEELGMMGSALFMTYAVGKFTNGFLADHANIRRFMSFGLLCSALINIFLGFNSGALLFIILWGLNGWFQSMGSAPSCVSIFQWFSPSQRGSRYSIWAGSHNIGEGLTFVITSTLVALWGWRASFLAPGLVSLFVVVAMLTWMRDHPRAHGLPEPGQVFGEPDVPRTKPALRSQLFVLRQPIVWVLGAACAMMYVSRYAINSWGLLYLQEAKGYGTIEAGFAMGAYPVLGLAGAVLAGLISDRFFNSDRHLPTLLYGLCNVAGMALLFWGPASTMLDAIALGIFGFGIGGLIVFLAGLTAAEHVPKAAIGATKGFIGLFAYCAAALQEYISGLLIQVKDVGDAKIYDFSAAVLFWCAAGLASIVLAWWARSVARRARPAEG